MALRQIVTAEGHYNWGSRGKAPVAREAVSFVAPTVKGAYDWLYRDQVYSKRVAGVDG